MRHDDQVEQYRIFVGDYLARSEENLAELESLQDQLAAGTPSTWSPPDELASEFIHSVETGAEREIYVNVRNDGLIANLPADCCVEVPCDLSAGQAGPAAVGALPVAARRAEPDVPQRSRAHRARGPGGQPGARLPGGAAGPEHRGHAHHRARPSPCATSCWPHKRP